MQARCLIIVDRYNRSKRRQFSFTEFTDLCLRSAAIDGTKPDNAIRARALELRRAHQKLVRTTPHLEIRAHPENPGSRHFQRMPKPVR